MSEKTLVIIEGSPLTATQQENLNARIAKVLRGEAVEAVSDESLSRGDSVCVNTPVVSVCHGRD